MLSDHPVYATLPTADVEALRRFYEDVLGFAVKSETPAGIYYQAGNGTYFAITRSSGRPSGSHTQMGLEITNIEDEVATLRARGAVFEEYETPKTVDGIADVGVGRAAWLKDPDGNLIGIIEFKQATLLVAIARRGGQAGPRIAIAPARSRTSRSTRSSTPRTAPSRAARGVDGAIHRAAGPRLAEEARALAPVAPGDARITAGYRLKAKHVIHTVGPMWAGGDQGEPETLSSCYRRSLALAEEAGVRSLAIPAISTGIYGYPAAKAASVAVREIAMWLDTHELPETVILSAFSADAAMVLRRAIERLRPARPHRAPEARQPAAVPWWWPACARPTSRARSSTGTSFCVPASRSLQLDLPLGQLVADDHREVGSIAGRRLQLLAELARRELRPGGDPRGPQDRGDPQPLRRVAAGSAPTTTATGAAGSAPAARPAPRARAAPGRGRARSRCPASACRRAARPARRSGRRRRAPAAGPRAPAT